MLITHSSAKNNGNINKKKKTQYFSLINKLLAIAVDANFKAIIR